MKTMMEILRDLTPLNRAVCSLGYDQAVDYLTDVFRFASSRVHRLELSTTGG